MKAKKVLAIVVILALAVAAVTGCTATQTGNDKNDQGQTVISVGNWPTKEGTALDLITKQKAEFEEANPDISIVPDTWAFDLQTFYSKAAAGQLPNVYYSNFTEIEKIISGDYGADITDGLKRAGYENVYNESILDLISRDGKIYTYPTDAYTLGLAYNADLFEQAGLMNDDGTPQQPKTWDDVIEFGKKIKETTGKAGFIIPTMNNNGGWIFSPIAWSYGVEFVKANDDGSYTATFDCQEMYDALKFISDLKWEHGIFVDNILIDPDEYYRQFSLGNVGMILGAPNMVDRLKKFEMPFENIGIMPIPEGPAKHVTLTGGYTATVSAGATEDQIDAAIKWLEKTGKGFRLDDVGKQAIEEEYQKKIATNTAVGIDTLKVYKDDTEVAEFRKEMLEKYANVDLNHVKLYNESLNDTSIELHPEVEICAQELYGTLDKLIQEVLTNQNADIPSLVSTANKEFQSNYLDNLN